MGFNILTKTNSLDDVRKILQQIKIKVDIEYVPYSGANYDVDLGTHDLLANEVKSTNLTGSRIVYSDSNKVLQSILELSSWIIGTVNQVIVTDTGSGGVVLSLPQDINMSGSPSFFSINLNSTSGTIPINISGTSAMCPNLNADLLDGLHANDFLKLDQTTPQTVINGKPIFDEGIVVELIKFKSYTLLVTPVKATLEYANDRFYITNVGTQRSIDRTSDVALSTETVENTTTETLVYTGLIAANSLRAGNILKINMSGEVDEESAADFCTIRIKFGGVTITSIVSPGAGTANQCWHIDGFTTIRSIGASGIMAWHADMTAGTGSAEVCGVTSIDTTAAENITITAQWNNAKAGNIFRLTQGFMEFKN